MFILENKYKNVKTIISSLAIQKQEPELAYGSYFGDPYSTVIRTNNTQLYAIMLNLIKQMLSERSQTQKGMYCKIPFT